MPSTIDCARGLLYFLGPVTGQRATGQIAIKPKAGVSSATLGPNQWVCPVINGALRPEILYRVLPNLPNKSNAAVWNVPSGGALVDAEAHVGGTRYNLAAGTPLRWADIPPDGFDNASISVAPGGFAGADNVPIYGDGPDLLRNVAIYEALGKSDVDMFRSRMGEPPAAVLVWTGSRTPEFAGRGASRYWESWSLILVVDRADSDPARRGEGMRLLDAIEDLVLYQSVAGDDTMRGFGIVVSAQHTVNVRARRRVTGNSEVYQKNYVYALDLDTVRIAEKVDLRSWNSWRKTRLDGNLPPATDTDPEPLPIVVDNEFDMVQDD